MEMLGKCFKEDSEGIMLRKNAVYKGKRSSDLLKIKTFMTGESIVKDVNFHETEKKIKSLNNKLSNVESKINQLERDIKAIDVELEINYEEASSKPNFFDEYQKMKTDLQALMSKWEGIQLEIEQFVD